MLEARECEPWDGRHTEHIVCEYSVSTEWVKKSTWQHIDDQGGESMRLTAAALRDEPPWQADHQIGSKNARCPKPSRSARLGFPQPLSIDGCRAASADSGSLLLHDLSIDPDAEPDPCQSHHQQSVPEHRARRPQEEKQTRPTHRRSDGQCEYARQRQGDQHAHTTDEEPPLRPFPPEGILEQVPQSLHDGSDAADTDE